MTPCASFSDTLFQESSVELDKAVPFAKSREEITSVAVLDGGDPGEIGSLSDSVLSPKLAAGDGEIDAGPLLHSCLTRPEPHSTPAVQVVKIEEEVEDEEVVIIADPWDDAAVLRSCPSRAAADEVARPMEGLGQAGPAPFLRKAYEMVSDPDTDPVVSWGSSRDSFVVWDEHEFSKQVLPRYFKHSNFSSFIRQLNTYVEFDPLGASSYSSLSQWIIPGAKRLGSKGLYSRRLRRFSGREEALAEEHKEETQICNHTRPWSSTVTLDYPNAGKEAELETLKKDQEAVKAEILKVREEQENLQHEINQVTERIRYAECRHLRMFLFLSKAAKSPNFVQHLIQERRRKRELETCESSKKSKLLGPDGEAIKCLLEVMDHKIQSPDVDYPRIIDDSAQMESGPNNVVLDDFGTIQMHNLWPPLMGGGDFRIVQGQTHDQMAGTSPSDLPPAFHEMSEKFLGDNVVVGDDAEDVEVEELAMDDTGIYLELEGLIEKSCGWSENTSELGEQAVGLTH